MRRILAASTAVTTLVAVGTILATTAGGTKASAKATLTLYSGQHPQTVNAIVGAFEKATGISAPFARTTRESSLPRSSRRARTRRPTSS